MQLTFFDSAGWQTWNVDHKPAIPEGMPILIDDDLRFEDGPGQPRPVIVVNQWLRELPSSGGRSPHTWAVYARMLRDWLVFLRTCGVCILDSREQLRLGLSAYAAHRSVGPHTVRLEASTWNQHMSVLSSFYRWAVAEGFASAEPFTYRQAIARYGDQVRHIEVNQAIRRVAKPHVTIKYLERDFSEMFVRALSGLDPQGREDVRYRGRELLRNGAMGQLALATGMRLREFSYLLVYEIPPLPAVRTAVPIAFPVPTALTKGGKFRTTWITYDALASVHRYISLDRALRCAGSAWRPSAPLVLTEADARGGRINGERVRWDVLRVSERRRLVAPDGGSPLLAVRNDGGPFTAWATVFRRVSERLRRHHEPRFPHVHPHRTRHSFAMTVLEWLVSGYFQQAAQMVAATDADAALLLYLSKADPLMVLRDLLGHSTVLTTEKY